MTRDKIKKISIFILILIAFAIIQLFIKNNIVAITFLVVLIIMVLVYLKFSNNVSKKKRNKIIQQTKKVRANIKSVRIFNRDSIILSLLIEHPEKFYTTSYIISNADDEEKDKYKPDQQIFVYVNPDNKYEVFLPEIKKTYERPRRNGGIWITILSIGITGISFIIPFIIDMFDYSDRVFKDIAYIKVNGQKENIWEVRFESPKKIYIKIYDPVAKEKIKSIKDKKENDLDYYANFYICQQNQKVFIIGSGNSPVIDVYDAVSLEKISDIKKFEETNKIFSQGIASILYKTQYNKLTNEEVIEITTNDGNKCFYDIPKNIFFYSENELNEYFEEADYGLISQQMFAFVLSSIPNSVDKHQLYLIETGSKKGVESLQKLAGTNSLDIDYFNENHNYYYKYCEIKPLCDAYFLRGKFIYFDESIAIIHHVTAINENAEELLSGIDKSGKTLFKIKQSDFPNIDDMLEDQYKPIDRQELETVRIDDKIVFLFNKYGALSVDIKTGKIHWKYEP